MRDPEQPAREASRRIERGEVAERPDERFLGEVLGLRQVARDARNQADDRPLVAGNELLEGRLRTGERLDDEPGFADRFEVNRDGLILRLETTQRRRQALHFALL